MRKSTVLPTAILILLSTLLPMACGASDSSTRTTISGATPTVIDSLGYTLTAAPFVTPIISVNTTPYATATAFPANFTLDTPQPIVQTDIPVKPQTALAIYPPDTRVDVPILDNIIEAVTLRDAERLQDLIHFTTMGCTHADGMGAPAKCLEAEAEGTLVEGLPTLGYEGWVWRREDVDQIVQIILDLKYSAALYAVYAQTDEAIQDSDWVRLPARYGIVFTYPPNDYLHALLVDDVGVVRVYSADSFDDLSRFFSGEFILPPRE